MKAALTYLLVGLLWSATVCHAYFYVPNFMSTLPFKGGMAYATRGNSLILFGGENATTSYTNDLYQLTQTGQSTTSSFTWQKLPQTNAPSGNLYGQGIVSKSGDTFLLMGGVSQSTVNQIVPLQMYSYSFSTQSWSAWPNNTMNATVGVPLNRQLFSATYDNDTMVYICGGALNASIIFNNCFGLNTNTMQFSQLANLPLPRYGHTASLLR